MSWPTNNRLTPGSYPVYRHRTAVTDWPPQLPKLVKVTLAKMRIWMHEIDRVCTIQNHEPRFLLSHSYKRLGGRYISKSAVPDDFLRSNIIPLPKAEAKNANVSNSDNYRGITFTSVFGRTLGLESIYFDAWFIRT
jgi:hypothetical protein